MTVSNLLPADLLIEPSPITRHYMLMPIEQGFNWEACFAQVSVGEWYLVVFRSKHKADADEDYLNLLDARATRGAQQTPGFLFYFTGTPLPSGECLSFCLWKDRAAARAGASHSAHRDAVLEGLGCFETYTLERYSIHKANGRVSFTMLDPMPDMAAR
jgi:heme-degrading monooxygenase HmoA